MVVGGARLCSVLPVSLVCFCCSGGWGSEIVWYFTCEFGLFLW